MKLPDLLSYLVAGFQGLFLIALAPGVAGLLKFLKAALVGRPRPVFTILQGYFDLYAMMRRPAVHPASTTWLFAITPFCLLAAYASLAFAVPVLQTRVLVAGDLVLVICILGFARFTLSLAGLDIVAPFAWLGSAQEMFYQFNTEIGFGFFLAALAIRWPTSTVSGLVQSSSTNPNSPLVTILLGAAFAINLFLEAGRLPIDNQETHYELTMGQKGVALQFAGKDLALIEWGEMIKLAFLLTLFADLFSSSLVSVPAIVGLWELFGRIAVYILEMVTLVIFLALWETLQVKLRVRQVPDYTWRSALLCVAAIGISMFPT